MYIVRVECCDNNIYNVYIRNIDEGEDIKMFSACVRICTTGYPCEVGETDWYECESVIEDEENKFVYVCVDNYQEEFFVFERM